MVVGAVLHACQEAAEIVDDLLGFWPVGYEVDQVVGDLTEVDRFIATLAAQLLDARHRAGDAGLGSLQI